MSAPAFFLHCLESSAKQVNSVFNGIAESLWDHQITPEAMSPRQTAIHLAQCYTAFITEANGEPWDWSKPFDLGTSEPSAVLSRVNTLRAEAIDLVRSTEIEEVLTKAADFILMHDCYHVGQMALFRMSTDPNWDPYSIY